MSAHHSRSRRMLCTRPHAAVQTRNLGLISRNPSTMTILYRRNIGDGKEEKGRKARTQSAAQVQWRPCMRGAVGGGRGRASPCPPALAGGPRSKATCVSAHHSRSGHVLGVTPLTAEQTRNLGLIFRNPSTMTILYRRNIGDGKRKREETRKHTHTKRGAG